MEGHTLSDNLVAHEIGSLSHRFCCSCMATIHISVHVHSPLSDTTIQHKCKSRTVGRVLIASIY